VQVLSAMLNAIGRLPGRPFHELRGTQQPDAQNCEPALYAAHQRVLEEDRESLAYGRALHGLVQFVKVHRTLKVTPALAAGVMDRLWSMDDLVALIDAWDDAQPRQKPGRKPKGYAAP